MKTLKSILLGTLIAVGGVALAMNAKTQESICTELNHEGFSYPEGQTPPATSSPANLPPNMLSIGTYEEDFECSENNLKNCHWVYQPAQDGNPGQWVLCKGEYVDLR